MLTNVLRERILDKYLHKTHPFTNDVNGISLNSNSITKTSLFKYIYIENFTTKNENFQMKNSGSFHISPQNIDCGYLLEPALRGGSYKYSHYMIFEQK